MTYIAHVFAYDAHSDKPFDTKYRIGGLVTPGDNSAAAESLTGAPQRGSIWRHYKGGIYTVLGCTFLGPDMHSATIFSEQTAHVVYLSGHGEVWVRRLRGPDGWLTPTYKVPVDTTQPVTRFTEIQINAAGKVIDRHGSAEDSMSSGNDMKPEVPVWRGEEGGVWALRT